MPKTKLATDQLGNKEGEIVLSTNTLKPGTGVKMGKPSSYLIDENTLGLWHLQGNLDNEIEGSSYSIPSTVISSFSTTYHKFGEQSGEVRTNNATMTLIDISDVSEFTFDFWVYSLGSNADTFTLNNIDGFTVKFTSGQIILPGNQTEYVSGWQHIAIQRKYGYNYLFINGSLKYSVQDTEDMMPPFERHSATAIQFTSTGHTSANNNVICYNEMRFSNVARYQGAFTPNTVMYRTSTADDEKQAEIAATVDNRSTSIGTVNIEGDNKYSSPNSTAIGAGANAVSDSVSIGAMAYNGGGNCISIGKNARSGGVACLAIGADTKSSGAYTIVIGSPDEDYMTGEKVIAQCSAAFACQIGPGNNKSPYSLQFRDTQVVNGSGKIPLENVDISKIAGYDATKTQVLKHIQGVLTWVDEA